jgi:hypothetical protein
MIRSVARTALPVVVALFLACAVVQVFLAGLGVFDDPGAFISHRQFGYLFGWLTLVALALALAGRAPGRITGLSALLLGLFALQSVLVAFRSAMPALAALHPLNGFLLLAVAVVTLRLSWAARSSATVDRMSVPRADPADTLAGTRPAAGAEVLATTSTEAA